MEVKRNWFSARWEKFAYKTPAAFSAGRELNWPKLRGWAAGLIALAVLGLLLVPASPEPVSTFQAKGRIETASASSTAIQSSGARTGQLPGGFSNSRQDYGYQGPASIPKGSGAGSSMIITRGGLDLRTQLPPGSRIRIRLLDRSVLSAGSLPLIGVVAADFVQDGEIAVEAGAKVFGDATFDGDVKAQINWKAIQMPDGRERPFAAVGASADGELGVPGDVHSNAAVNAVGETLTQFVGAFAAGSMQTGIFGQNPGGSVNGLRNAVAETAKDRAQGFGNDLQKEKRWIELPAGSEAYAVLTQAFTFKDPGGAR